MSKPKIKKNRVPGALISIIIGLVLVAGGYFFAFIGTPTHTYPIAGWGGLIVGSIFIIFGLFSAFMLIMKKPLDKTVESLQCEECGFEVKESDESCPNCGVEFEEE